MKLQSLTLILGVLLLASIGTLPVSAEACSCSAPDDTCGTESVCGDSGCYAYCQKASCSSRCVKKSKASAFGGAIFGPQELRDGPAFRGYPPSELRYHSLTLQFDTARTVDVASYLSAELGTQVSFTTRDSDELLTIDAKNLPAGKALELLGRRGGVAIAGGGEIELIANQLSASHISSLLSESLGVAIEFVPSKGTEEINLEIHSAPIEEFLRALDEKGDVRFLDSF